MKKAIILKSGREKSLLRRHPWIFSGAIQTIVGEPENGETVLVENHKNQPIGSAAYSSGSQLTGRMWSFNPAEPIDEAFFTGRIRRAVELRNALGINAPDGACRLIGSEADGLPGLIVDRYADFAVAQISSAGAFRHRELIAEILRKELKVKGIYERSDVAVRAHEGLPEYTGLLIGEEPPGQIVFSENGLQFTVDVRHGHKTGFYLDQRENRRLVRSYAANRKVLNCFAYSGSFAVAALAGGAVQVVNVDSSAPALALAEENCKLNGFGPETHENRVADVFTQLRQSRDAGEKFDMVILDPPKFIDNRGSLPRGCRAYQDIARLGFQLLNPGGLLFNFSCSGLMPAELFQKITADAALDAGVEGRIIGRMEQSSDHPTGLAIPESFYLKGFIVAV
jgi:23S rRNA (cytosine1962-C5)-methyltransferase